VRPAAAGCGPQKGDDKVTATAPNLRVSRAFALLSIALSRRRPRVRVPSLPSAADRSVPLRPASAPEHGEPICARHLFAVTDWSVVAVTRAGLPPSCKASSTQLSASGGSRTRSLAGAPLAGSGPCHVALGGPSRRNRFSASTQRRGTSGLTAVGALANRARQERSDRPGAAAPRRSRK
jgi:hypothetical protein